MMLKVHPPARCHGWWASSLIVYLLPGLGESAGNTAATVPWVGSVPTGLHPPPLPLPPPLAPQASTSTQLETLRAEPPSAAAESATQVSQGRFLRFECCAPATTRVPVPHCACPSLLPSPLFAIPTRS